jgi:hypothetical protein
MWRRDTTELNRATVQSATTPMTNAHIHLYIHSYVQTCMHMYVHAFIHAYNHKVIHTLRKANTRNHTASTDTITSKSTYYCASSHCSTTSQIWTHIREHTYILKWNLPHETYIHTFTHRNPWHKEGLRIYVCECKRVTLKEITQAHMFLTVLSPTARGRVNCMTVVPSAVFNDVLVRILVLKGFTPLTSCAAQSCKNRENEVSYSHST